MLPNSCAMTVAKADPFIPKLKRKINKGSSAILHRAPMRTVIIEILIFPSARKTALDNKPMALKGMAKMEINK